MRNLVYLILAVAVLGGLYMVFEGQRRAPESPAVVAAPATGSVSAASPAGDAPAVASNDPAPVAAPNPVIEYRISGGKLQSGPPVVKLTQGDQVTLQILSDTADEVHLHLSLRPNEPATLSFAATRTGRFTFELHHAHLDVGALEIYPSQP